MRRPDIISDERIQRLIQQFCFFDFLGKGTAGRRDTLLPDGRVSDLGVVRQVHCLVVLHQLRVYAVRVLR